MSVASESSSMRSWSKPAMIKSPWLRWGVMIAISLYVVIAVRSFEVNFERIAVGLERGYQILLAFLRPDFVSRNRWIVRGVLESLTMTITATTLGVFMSVLVILGAARNISSLPVYLVWRGILIVVRSLHVVVLAILFVVMIGFGPLAGAITLALNSIGFIGKIMAEEIENINEETLEAIRSTGASWPQLVIYGVWPQIATRFIGVSIYQLDINFRQSSIVGLVGAGGIGAILDTAMKRYDYNTATAILLVIIGLVLVSEYISSSIRRRLK